MAETIENVNTVAGGVSHDDDRPSRQANYGGEPPVLPAGDTGWSVEEGLTF
jgi:hypothetical protein